jgi:hypothetical protein
LGNDAAVAARHAGDRPAHAEPVAPVQMLAARAGGAAGQSDRAGFRRDRFRTISEGWVEVCRRARRLGWHLEFRPDDETQGALRYHPRKVLPGGRLVVAGGHGYRLRGPLPRTDWSIATLSRGRIGRIAFSLRGRVTDYMKDVRFGDQAAGRMGAGSNFSRGSRRLSCLSARCAASSANRRGPALVQRRRPADLRRTAAEAGVRRRFAPHQLRHAHAVEMARGRHSADRDPTAIRPQQPRHQLDLPPRNRQRRDHRDRPRSPRTGDPRQRVTPPLNDGRTQTVRRAKRHLLRWSIACTPLARVARAAVGEGLECGQGATAMIASWPFPLR